MTSAGLLKKHKLWPDTVAGIKAIKLANKFNAKHQSFCMEARDFKLKSQNLRRTKHV